MSVPHTSRRAAAALFAVALLTTSAPAPATAAPVSTSWGARYDPAKCRVSSATWKGHRRFYLNSATHAGCFTSPWWQGAHPVMLSFGRTTAPWYPSHVHHGVDIDMPIGTPVYSAVAGKVLLRPAILGSAYGSNRLLVRSGGTDHVLGHLGRVAVRNGQTVRAGQLIGWSGMSGCQDEDGPHLHLEVRPAGLGYRSAVNPWTASHVHRI